MSKVVVCRVVLLTLVLVAVLGAHASAFTDPTCFRVVVKCFEDSAISPISGPGRGTHWTAS